MQDVNQSKQQVSTGHRTEKCVTGEKRGKTCSWRKNMLHVKRAGNHVTGEIVKSAEKKENFRRSMINFKKSEKDRDHENHRNPSTVKTVYKYSHEKPSFSK